MSKQRKPAHQPAQPEPGGWLPRAGRRAAALLDQHLVVRLIAAGALTAFHLTAVLTLPPATSTLAFTVATMTVGVVVLILTGAWRTTHRWAALWFLIFSTVPTYAPMVMLVGQVWVLNRAWIEHRGLIETIRHQPGRTTAWRGRGRGHR